MSELQDHIDRIDKDIIQLKSIATYIKRPLKASDRYKHFNKKKEQLLKNLTRLLRGMNKLGEGGSLSDAADEDPTLRMDLCADILKPLEIIYKKIQGDEDLGEYWDKFDRLYEKYEKEEQEIRERGERRKAERAKREAERKKVVEPHCAVYEKLYEQIRKIGFHCGKAEWVCLRYPRPLNKEMLMTFLEANKAKIDKIVKEDVEFIVFKGRRGTRKEYICAAHEVFLLRQLEDGFVLIAKRKSLKNILHGLFYRLEVGGELGRNIWLTFGAENPQKFNFNLKEVLECVNIFKELNELHSVEIRINYKDEESRNQAEKIVWTRLSEAELEEKIELKTDSNWSEEVHHLGIRANIADINKPPDGLMDLINSIMNSITNPEEFGLNPIKNQPDLKFIKSDDVRKRYKKTPSQNWHFSIWIG